MIFRVAFNAFASHKYWYLPKPGFQYKKADCRAYVSPQTAMMVMRLWLWWRWWYDNDAVVVVGRGDEDNYDDGNEYNDDDGGDNYGGDGDDDNDDYYYDDDNATAAAADDDDHDDDDQDHDQDHDGRGLNYTTNYRCQVILTRSHPTQRYWLSYLRRWIARAESLDEGPLNSFLCFVKGRHMA